MTTDVQINGFSFRPVLAGPPTIHDSTDNVCRTVDITIIDTVEVGDLMGKELEVWYGGTRWFHGYIQRRGINSKGEITLTAYDGLFFLKKTTDDFYFKNMTANQALLTLAKKAGVPTATLANTGAVFAPLWYPGKPADQVAIDLLARTYAANGRKFWLRWNPEALGIDLFERFKPKEAWSFLAGVNLTEAAYEESIEDVYNVVKLVNRETGKVVTKTNADSVKLYRTRQHFEEVDKDSVKTMDKIAEQKLAEVSKVAVTMSFTGVNPNNSMRQFFTGDVVYIEEQKTGIVGAYYIKNLTQTLINDDLVEVAADVQHAPDIPTLQYDDANKKPDFLKTKAEKEAERKKKSTQKKTKSVVEKKTEKTVVSKAITSKTVNEQLRRNSGTTAASTKTVGEQLRGGS